MKNTNLKLIIAAVLIIIIALMSWYYLKDKESVENYSNQEQSIRQKEKSDLVMSDNIENSADIESKQELVSEYISENISDLSPEEAVLGGSFYLTGIRFTDDNTAVIDYEDGHIALNAAVKFSVTNGVVLIESFDIITDKSY